MDEVPRYRALEPIALQPAGASRPRVIKPNEEFAYEGEPGLELLPLNASARRAKLEQICPHHYGKNSVNLHRLARSLGFTGHDRNSAVSFIKSFGANQTARLNATPSPLENPTHHRSK
jgi:hypothetical protein